MQTEPKLPLREENPFLANVCLHYTSGTESSLHILKELCLRFSKAGFPVQIRFMGQASADPLRGKLDASYLAYPAQTQAEIKGELDVFLFPVYGFSAPVHVYSYLKKLLRNESCKNRTALVIATHGGGPFGAAPRFARFLTRKGWQVLAWHTARLPAQWTQVGEVPNPEEVPQLLASAREEFASWISSCIQLLKHLNLDPDLGRSKQSFEAFKAQVPPEFFKDTWDKPGPARLFGALVGPLFRLFPSRMLGKLYAADESCNHCGLCVRACPQACIKLDTESKRPSWGLNCSACNRCINLCPQKSIQCTWARLYSLIFFDLIALNLWIVFLIIDGLRGFIAGLVLGALALVFQVTYFDKILQKFEASPKHQKAFTSGWTKKFDRYRAPAP